MRIKLNVPGPSRVNGIAADPDPDWTFDALVSELNSLETKLKISSTPFIKAQSRDVSTTKSVERSSKPFGMGVHEGKLPDIHRDSKEVRLNCDKKLLSSKPFVMGVYEEDELPVIDSDGRNSKSFVMGVYEEDELQGIDSDGQSLGSALANDESTLEAQAYLMENEDLVEASLAELTYDHQSSIKEEIRNLTARLETELKSKIEKSNSAFFQIEKYREARREADRRLDAQYQRKIAEALDNYLTAIRRDHELRSQIEERKIKSDAAFEEAKRKEKALLEEKRRQEKAKVEAEVKARAEEAKKAAIEAERRAVKEAAEKEAAEKEAADYQAETTKALLASKSINLVDQPIRTAPGGTNLSRSLGSMIKASESALTLEQERLQKLKEVEEGNQTLRLSSNKDFSTHERHIARLIRQIRGTKENVRTKASELLKIFMDPLCPQTISIVAFAKKVVSHCESPDNAAFACGHVIVLVTSQVPNAMVLLLAEFHRACIYTVPKHIAYSEAAFESKGSYFRTIGFREDDGKMESVNDYLKRLEACMKLYGALIQTEVAGVRNLHGLEEGWAWLARFLNSVPPNLYTATALNAFLQTTGFALFRKYKSQFWKLLNIISDNFLGALKAKENQGLKQIIVQIESYLEDKKFLQEPEGRSLQGSLLSSVMVPDSDYRESYGARSSNSYF